VVLPVAGCKASLYFTTETHPLKRHVNRVPWSFSIFSLISNSPSSSFHVRRITRCVSPNSCKNHNRYDFRVAA